MNESAVPVGLAWAAFMGGTTIGLMVLLRPFATTTPRRSWVVFALLALLDTAFFAAAIAANAVWSGRDWAVAMITFVGFVWFIVLVVLLVGLVVLPMKRERSPRRGGFSTPRQGP